MESHLKDCNMISMINLQAQILPLIFQLKLSTPKYRSVSIINDRNENFKKPDFKKIQDEEYALTFFKDSPLCPLRPSLRMRNY